MGANEFELGFDFVVTDVVFVVCDGVGRVEAGEFFVFVLLQDSQSVLVEDDGQAVVGLLGGDG